MQHSHAFTPLNRPTSSCGTVACHSATYWRPTRHGDAKPLEQVHQANRPMRSCCHPSIPDAAAFSNSRHLNRVPRLLYLHPQQSQSSWFAKLYATGVSWAYMCIYFIKSCLTKRRNTWPFVSHAWISSSSFLHLFIQASHPRQA